MNVSRGLFTSTLTRPIARNARSVLNARTAQTGRRTSANVRRNAVFNVNEQAQKLNKMTTWQYIRRGVYITLASIAVWWGAVTSIQPTVTTIQLPIAACGVNRWVLTNDYNTSVVVSGKTYNIHIARGFVTDLASLGSTDKLLGVPRDHPAIRRGALVHDALFASHLVDYSTANSILNQCCLDDGMEFNKAKAVWTAVEAWGWKAWQRTTAQINEARLLVHLSSR